jgi:L-lysine exporter family protein LysE/ArgO
VHDVSPAGRTNRQAASDQVAKTFRAGKRSAIFSTLCVASDVILILGGTLGIGTLVTGFPGASTVLQRGGTACFAWWAARSFAAALKPSFLTADAPRSRGSVVATTLAVTNLNPHVYLDTLVLLGGLANQHGPDACWIFAAGAVLASALWFPTLAYGARALSGPLSTTRTWRIVDVTAGLLMLVLGTNLMLR